MIALFVAGTFWFWTLLAVASILIIISLETTWGGTGATITMIAAFLALIFFGDFPIKNVGIFIKDNPGLTLGLVVGYFVVGVVWSLAKWYFYLNSKIDNMIDARRNETSSRSLSSYEKEQLKSSYNKGEILSWMTYWPFSALWTLINDPIRKMFSYIFSKIESLYESISNKMVKNLEDKLKNQK